MKKLLLLAIVVLGISAVSFGQDEATVNTANASATILKTLSLNKGTTELNFGVIGANASETSTVILSKTGGLSGTATRYTGFGAEATTAEFIVEGTPSATFSLTLPSTISLTNAAVGGDPMEISSLVTDLEGATDRLDVLDATTGLKTFHVGGTLTVGADQDPGTYTATYTVTVNYN